MGLPRPLGDLPRLRANKHNMILHLSFQGFRMLEVEFDAMTRNVVAFMLSRSAAAANAASMAATAWRSPAGGNTEENAEAPLDASASFDARGGNNLLVCAELEHSGGEKWKLLTSRWKRAPLRRPASEPCDGHGRHSLSPCSRWCSRSHDERLTAATGTQGWLRSVATVWLPGWGRELRDALMQRARAQTQPSCSTVRPGPSCRRRGELRS